MRAHSAPVVSACGPTSVWYAHFATALVLSGVTDEETLLSPDNDIHPDYYMPCLPELLECKAVNV